MPYHLEKHGPGYYVVTTATGKRHSDRPLSKDKAEAQMRAMEAAEEEPDTYIHYFPANQEKNRYVWEHHLRTIKGKHSTFGHFG